MSTPSAVAASEHPLAAHAVAECAGSLLERDCTDAQVLLVAATQPFAGALGDIAMAFGELLGSAEVAAVCSGEIMAGARRIVGGAGIAVMALGTSDASVSRIEPGSRPEGERGMTTVAFCDPTSTRAPGVTEGTLTEHNNRVRRSRESDAVSANPHGELLVVNLGDATWSGGTPLVVVSNGRLGEFRGGGLSIRVPNRACSLLEVPGFEAFAEPMRVSGVIGSSVTALDDLPAAEAFEAAVAGASGALDSATELRLRRVATDHAVGVRRSSTGLDCSGPLVEGELVEPVYRSPRSVALDLSGRLDGGRSPRLAVFDAGVVAGAATMASGTGTDMAAEAISEAAAGDHLGVWSKGVRGNPAGAEHGSDSAVRVLKIDR